MVYSTRRFVLVLPGVISFLCFLLFFFFFFFLFFFFSPLSIGVTSLGEERANLSAFCTFVWFCLFPLCLLFLLVSGKSCGL